MGVIDMLMINTDEIMKGFDYVIGNRHYLIAYDQQGKMLCTFYNTNEECKTIMKAYLKSVGINPDQVDYKELVKVKDPELLDEINNKKIVLLDKKFMLYNEVAELTKSEKIKGFTGKAPKYGINIYTTKK